MPGVHRGATLGEMREPVHLREIGATQRRDWANGSEP
jgi:hypothetical protein